MCNTALHFSALNSETNQEILYKWDLVSLEEEQRKVFLKFGRGLLLDEMTISLAELYEDQEMKHPLAKNSGNQKLLGKGNSGQVLKAFYRKVPVAVKELLQEKAKPAQKADFFREAELSSLLSFGDRVVTCLGVNVSDERPCIAMELMEKNSLAEHMQTSKIDDLLVLCDAAHGILHLHNQGYIHRDIRASNFLVDGLDNVSVADFGLTRRLTRPDEMLSYTDATGTIPIPWAWSAPETLRLTPQLGRAFSRASDVWMFGMLVWEVVSRAKEDDLYKIMKRALVEAAQPSVAGEVDQCVATTETPQPSAAHCVDVFAEVDQYVAAAEDPQPSAAHCVLAEVDQYVAAAENPQPSAAHCDDVIAEVDQYVASAETPQPKAAHGDDVLAEVDQYVASAEGTQTSAAPCDSVLAKVDQYMATAEDPQSSGAINDDAKDGAAEDGKEGQGNIILNASYDLLQQGWRPALPHDCPQGLKELYEECCQLDAAARPTMQQVLARLESLLFVQQKL